MWSYQLILKRIHTISDDFMLQRSLSRILSWQRNILSKLNELETLAANYSQNLFITQ